MRRNQKGFTLVEIMIVVAIIALLAAIAIPNLLRARTEASRALALSTLRAISTACESYATASDGNYPTSEGSMLATTSNPPFLNRTYDTRTVSGYTYNAVTMNTTGYTVSATPTAGQGGVTFWVTTGGVLTP